MMTAERLTGMRQLSHSDRTAPSVGDLIQRGAARLRRARVFFGHGTDNAIDDAAALLWHAAQLPLAATPGIYARRVSLRGRIAYEALLQRRIRERVPAVYLTGRTWFAGLPLRTDSRALIPRSPIAELIEAQFQPWIDPRRLQRILDLGTGGGCIAIACAHWLPWVRVDAADVSDAALALARHNVRERGLGKRVRCVKSDHFSGLRGRRYDMIVSNPPYVGAREMAGLPAEYRHEPALALAAGRDGLDSVRVILAEAAGHLRPGGLLIVEVGNSQRAVERAFPRLPFLWLEFERGGGGVFLLTREQLMTQPAAPQRGARRRTRT
jgi:ribosomal protein L3 glutamine methyltransferase